MTIMALAGFGMKLGEGIKGKWAAKAANEVAKENLRFNQEVREIQKRDILQAGERQAQNVEAATRGIIGQQRVGFAGQGVDVDSETAKHLEAEARENAQRDAEVARLNAAKRAWGIEVEGINQAQMVKQQMKARENMAQATLAQAAVSGIDYATRAYSYNTSKANKGL